MFITREAPAAAGLPPGSSFGEHSALSTCPFFIYLFRVFTHGACVVTASTTKNKENLSSGKNAA
jgi:hypothetical protein